jgi:nicotinamidase-related amidase
MSKPIKKVLIVVDVQNCFITGGSLAAPINLPGMLKDSVKQIKEIENLIDQNEIIIFSRDYHPKNHMSLQNGNEREGPNTFNDHCRNFSRECPSKKKSMSGGSNNQDRFSSIEKILSENPQLAESIKDNKLNPLDKYKSQKIIGTDLSYLFYSTKYSDEILSLILDGKSKDPYFTIGLDEKANFTVDKGQQITDYIRYPPGALNRNNKDFIQLTKGELCNYESYSAFNYHIYLKPSTTNPKQVDKEDLRADGYTTGLFEYLNNTYSGHHLEITVCGLVTNICVTNTVHQGLAVYNLNKNNNKSNITISFNLSNKGSRFLSLTPPFITDIKSDQNFVSFKNFLIKDLEAICKINKIPKLEYNLLIEGEQNVPIRASYVEQPEKQTNKTNLFKPISTKGFKMPWGKGGMHDNNCGCENCKYKHKYLKYKQKYLELKYSTSN